MKKNKAPDMLENIILKFQNYIDPPNWKFPHLNQPPPDMDIISFIEIKLEKMNEIDQSNLKRRILAKAKKSINDHEENDIFSGESYRNAEKVINYYENKLTEHPTKIKLNNTISDKQIVYLFRILQENKYFINNKKEIAKALSLIFEIKESTATKYLSDKELEQPKNLFKVDWDEL